MLQKGSRAWYRRQVSDGTEDRVLVTVLSVHYDDSPPYYTVLLNGVERETVGERLEEFKERASLRQQLQAASLWYYVDDGGEQRGPFDAATLEGWLAAGYFKPTTPMAASFYGEVPEEHTPASELFGEAFVNMFHQGPCQPALEATAVKSAEAPHAPIADVVSKEAGPTDNAQADTVPTEGEQASSEPARKRVAERWEDASGTLEGGSDRPGKFLRLVGARAASDGGGAAAGDAQQTRSDVPSGAGQRQLFSALEHQFESSRHRGGRSGLG